MKNKLNNLIRNSRGFTLAETLLAVLILLMVSFIVATGVPVAKNAYEKVVLASNAEVLLSTTISSLRNELGTATRIEPEGTTITYLNETRGSMSKIYLDSSERNTIMLQRYIQSGGMGKDSDAVRLVSETASTPDLYVTYTSVTYSNGIITFGGLSVNRKSGSTGLAVRDSLSIRVISDPTGT